MVLCLLASNALHVLIPRQTGVVIDTLSGNSAANPWVAILAFAALQVVASDTGIDLLRRWLWIPVQYYSDEAMARAAYSHIMNLSADFHDSKSTSDMTVAITGGSALSNVVEMVGFEAAPMLIDMCIAVVYLSVTLGPYEGLITAATGSGFFLLAGRRVTQSKDANRRRIRAIYKESSVRNSGLLGWHTVSSFNQVGYEENRHADALAVRWQEEKQYMWWWSVCVALSNMVIMSGLLASAFLAVYRIRQGLATPGSFMMLLMYWAQLKSPLHFFSRLGRTVSDEFINAERLLNIMKATPSVENKKGARPFKFATGEVSFDNVKFSYDKKKEIIKSVSFSVPAGQTVAFVGATGAGKSTLLKLLDRFYDVTGGSIRIDDQDVRDVDLFR